MKIAVTGASGMLGTALISLLSKSHEVFATKEIEELKKKISNGIVLTLIILNYLIHGLKKLNHI